MFNSKEYNWSNVRLLLLGRPVIGARGVSYTMQQEKSLIYGTGDEPRAVQRGNVSYQGNISLLQSELEALIKASPDKNILRLSFDLIVSYVASENTAGLTMDILKHCEFTRMPKGMSQNDKMMEIELPFLFLSLKHQN